MTNRRHGPSQRVCVLGDTDDLPCIEALLASLPADAYGQAFLLAPAAPATLTAVPPRVMVSWLPRDEPDADATLRAALAAWTAEWIPAQRWVSPHPTVWVGASARRRLERCSTTATHDVLPTGSALVPGTEGQPIDDPAPSGDA